VSNQAFKVEKGSYKCIASLKTCNVKTVSKSLMLKTLKKVYKGNEGTNQMSMSESESNDNAENHQRDSVAPEGTDR